ncbi:SRPBCC family protein [Micrococcus sp.]|uniref:SRPBCC family protein n=1 Tax=Micrococcus sp. TaxID=1271 RepID=UPI002A91C799|nr:SRPBCC family protein [Micrococcus sp.]MDY6054999.1 SRPBCC family protein [Micrococcus sp.]
MDTSQPRPPQTDSPATDGMVSPAEALPSAAPQAAWPERVDAGERAVAYRLRVAAPAEELWALLADPHRHHEVDGSGTVRPRVQGPHRLEVGGRFTVAMRKYGLPYRITSTVTAAEPGRVVEWEHPGGHRWRWEFAPVEGDPTATDVTEVFDYSAVRPAQARAYELLRLDRDNARGIRASLTRLAARHL